MVLSTYAKQRILGLSEQGHKAPTIARLLREEGIKISRVAVYKFLKKYRTEITAMAQSLVDEKMEANDETTATQLHQMLIEHGTLVSLQTILRCRSALGWTFRGSAYCQLIRRENKVKRLAWAREYQSEVDGGFGDVIGATKVPYNWRAIRDFVVASKVALQSVSQDKAGAPITGIKLCLNYSLLTYQ